MAWPSSPHQDTWDHENTPYSEFCPDSRSIPWYAGETDRHIHAPHGQDPIVPSHRVSDRLYRNEDRKYGRADPASGPYTNRRVWERRCCSDRPGTHSLLRPGSKESFCRIARGTL